ncbi:hypothetical protein BC829DRAFT_382147, partial [Chytridium lagenaria]
MSPIILNLIPKRRRMTLGYALNCCACPAVPGCINPKLPVSISPASILCNPLSNVPVKSVSPLPKCDNVGDASADDAACEFFVSCFLLNENVRNINDGACAG